MALLGWIGMGRIGTQMALRLLQAGHELVVHDAVAERLAPARDKGARAACSPAELAEASESVFLSVTDTDAVESIVFGPQGIAAGGAAGKLVVDHTSIHPERTRDLAARLHAQCGMGWVDAPVSGSPGTLSVFLGGAAEDVARVRPWIGTYAGNMTHVGPLGLGQLGKSCNQAIVCATLVAWTEVLAYAQRFGMAPSILMEAVQGGGADSSARRYFTPDLLAGTLPFETTRNLAKDLETIADMAGSVGLPMPMTETVGTLFRQIFAGDTGEPPAAA
jgi:3-hydroxyisobutyrate dehydrogenase